MPAAGRLDRRVTIARKTETQDATGQPVETWSQWKKAWMGKRDVRAEERFRTDQDLATETTVWMSHYIDGLSEQDLLIAEGKTYDIVGIAELGRRSGYEITARANLGLAELVLVDLTIDYFVSTQGGNVAVTGHIPSIALSTNISIGASADDAIETSGVVTLNGTTIGIGSTPYGGFRFASVPIPQAATIVSANIQFTSGNTGAPAAGAMPIFGELAANAAQFTTGANNISSRSITTATVNWSPGTTNWTEGARGAEQLTPGLATIVQEIVNQGGWAANNAMAFRIGPKTTGGAGYVLVAFDHVTLQEATLTVSYIP